jgi:uncharacterized protein
MCQQGVQAMRWRRLIPSREKILATPGLGRLRPWLGHPWLWHWSRRGVALGVALGVFFGLLIPFAQIPMTATAAILLRANLPAAAASTLVSNPVTFAPIYYAAWHLGSWITGEDTLPDPEALADEPEHDGKGIWQRISALGKPLLVGLGIFACAGGLLTYALIDALWRWRTSRRWMRRKGRVPPN